MPCYWVGEKISPSETRLCRHNEAKINSDNYYLIHLNNEDDIKTNTGNYGCHLPLPRKNIN